MPVPETEPQQDSTSGGTRTKGKAASSLCGGGSGFATPTGGRRHQPTLSPRSINAPKCVPEGNKPEEEEEKMKLTKKQQQLDRREKEKEKEKESIYFEFYKTKNYEELKELCLNQGIRQDGSKEELLKWLCTPAEAPKATVGEGCAAQDLPMRVVEEL